MTPEQIKMFMTGCKLISRACKTCDPRSCGRPSVFRVVKKAAYEGWIPSDTYYQLEKVLNKKT